MDKDVIAINGNYIIIAREAYDRLKSSQALLTALENAGVDNWDGYDFALEELGV